MSGAKERWKAAGSQTDNRSEHSAGVMDRREFLNRMTIATGVLAAPAVLGCNVVDSRNPVTVTAKTVYGRVRGASDNGVLVFKGLPYAGSPATAFHPTAIPAARRRSAT